MNERIKALAVEADFMLCEDGHFYSEGQSQKITDGLQKFAELIVKECVSIVEPTQHHQAFAPSYLGDVEGLELLENKVTHIKKHFGV
jgi:uncharacterized protein (AIM24 family)